ncbi:type III pantothenate kinase [Chitinibacter bivalviorum]|uniref:Type III pantothenate kinase n=1 Tax=Chitinibacter bivalviorum TaxID=2739434 RepID=A0A7H9BE49_9NEIS|nr:type III pantothenate kinase [Chitinibacter bivalviorum]QLG86855.1 type III pantothenate kinase [Chitinibacter bivalviorum]
MNDVLLIDLGNTRMKWRLGDATQASQSTHDIAQFAKLTEALPHPSAILACVVGDEQRYADLTELCRSRWGITPQRLRVSRRALGVSNHYRDISEQGADRWAAVLGASQRFAGQNLIIVSAGTALVVDTLTAAGDFLGGTISPGLGLMKQSLYQGTAKLPHAAGAMVDFPQCTHDAIETGCQRAIRGIILEAINQLNLINIPTDQVIVFGGDAATLQALLNVKTQTVDNLVLDGLYALHLATDGVFSE